MSYRSWTRVLCVVGAFVALGCASATPQVSAAEAPAAQTLSYETPLAFSTKTAACSFAVKKARRAAVSACTVASLSVGRDDCECSRKGSHFGCTIEASYTCQ